MRAAVPAGATQPLPETSDPTSTMRTAVYPPSRNVGDSPTNENSPFQIGLDSSRFPGLYKPAVPDQQQDTWTRHLRATSSGSGPPPHPPDTFEREAQDQDQGQELCTSFSRVRDALIHTLLWKPPCQSQQPFSVQTCRILEVLSSPRNLLQTLQETPKKPLYSGIPASQTLTSTGALV